VRWGILKDLGGGGFIQRPWSTQQVVLHHLVENNDAWNPIVINPLLCAKPRLPPVCGHQMRLYIVYDHGQFALARVHGTLRSPERGVETRESQMKQLMPALL
jgi:hypothetical protein